MSDQQGKEMQEERGATGTPLPTPVHGDMLKNTELHRLDWMEQILSHPFMERFSRQPEAEYGPPTAAWESMAVRMTVAGRILMGQAEMSTLGIRLGEKEVADWESQSLLVTSALLNAELFMFTEHTEQLAAAAPLPPHDVNPDVLPYPSGMFLTLPRQVVVRLADDDVLDFATYASADEIVERGENIHDTQMWADGVWVYVQGGPKALMIVMGLGVTMDEAIQDPIDHPYLEGGHGLILHSTHILWGSRFPDDIPAGSLQAAILRYMAFINSPYVESEPGRLLRSERRTLQRAGVVDHDPEVHVIALRRPEPSGERSESNGSELRRDYSHQWWTKGHYRNQWYPSRDTHRLIWIRPFLKGPADKPVREKVYRVTR